jgi:hypothetical protein
LGSVAVEGCNDQSGLLTVTIRHNLQKTTALAARIPGQTACFRKLFGNNLNLIISHIRVFQYRAK